MMPRPILKEMQGTVMYLSTVAPLYDIRLWGYRVDADSNCHHKLLLTKLRATEHRTKTKMLHVLDLTGRNQQGEARNRYRAGNQFPASCPFNQQAHIRINTNIAG
jgi:hypothetical protein